MGTKLFQLLLLPPLVLIGGCAAVQPRQSFDDIQHSISDRTPYRIHWNNGTEADRAVESEIDALLAQPLDANAAVQVALLNNRNLQATYESLGIAQADLVEAGLLKNPVFDGSVRFPFAGGSPTIDLGIAFEFLDVFFIGLRKNLAEARLESAKASVTAAVLDLSAETKTAFYALQAAEQTAEMRRQVASATSASYDLAQRIRQAGNNRALDVANERALYEESRIALAASETDAVQKREDLNRLMGLWGPRTSWTVSGRLNEPSHEEASGEGLEKRAVESSLDLRARRAEIAIAQRELGITQPLGYLSELEVGASAERDDGEWELGPSVSLPIPIFSQGQPAVARAQAEMRRAQQRYYSTAVEIRAAVRAAFARTRALREQVNHFRTVMLPLRQTIVDETQLQYNAMQIGAFQLLQAKRDQIEAGRAYITLLREYWTARTELELILSGRMARSPRSESGSELMPVNTNSSGGH